MKVGYVTSKNGGLLEQIIKKRSTKGIEFTVLADRITNKLQQRILKNNLQIYLFRDESELCNLIERLEFDLVILGGYLRILSSNYCDRFGDKTINIHPGTLENKGLNPQKRVLRDKSKIIGNLIHFVSSEVDSGRLLYESRIYCRESITIEEMDKLLKEDIIPILIDIINYWGEYREGNINK